VPCTDHATHQRHHHQPNPTHHLYLRQHQHPTSPNVSFALLRVLSALYVRS
jgi:hypothetical protein